MAHFYSNGKLLLSGEYLVLDGAKALGLPTKFGQSLSVKTIEEPLLIWESYNHISKKWLQVTFDLPKLRIISETFTSNIAGGSDSLALSLQDILLKAKFLNSNFLNTNNGLHVTTQLNFPRNWGLGSSSTLINNVANWAKVNAFDLQFSTFGGSGYDIACAQNNSPVIYQVLDKKPQIKTVNFNPNFKKQLFFIHLNKKQNSRKGIAAYKNYNADKTSSLDKISGLTENLLQCNDLIEFEKLMNRSGTTIS